MKNLYLVILALLFAAAQTATAAESLSFTWTGATGSKNFTLRVTPNKGFTVNWGDGITDVLTGAASATATVTASHTYGNTGTYTVTVTGSDDDTFLTYLDVSNKQVSAVDVTHAASLQTLRCYINRIAKLDLSGNPALTELRCYDNRIPWADLCAASLKISATSGKYLGTQTIVPVNIAPNVSVTLDGVFDGAGTVFTMAAASGSIVEGTDYEIAGGNITFKTAGVYTVEITNSGVTSYSSSPAKAVVTYVVGTVATQQIVFTWAGAASRNFGIQASKFAPFTVDWGDGNTENYTGNGTSTVTLTHNYGNTGTYTVTVAGSEVATLFTFLDVSNRQVSAIDVTHATALQTLYCNTNHITALDLSGNSALTQLRCYDNALSWADLCAASSKISTVSGKYLGTQYLASANIALNVPVTLDGIFDGAGTVFAVAAATRNIAEGVDYEIAGGNITFKTAGVYTVEITNPAVTSYSSYPAKAVATYVAGTVASQHIAFTWTGATGNKNFTVYASKYAPFTVDWGDGNTDTFTGNGTSAVSPSHVYGNTGVYTVTVTGNAAATIFTRLDVNGKQLSELIINEAPALETLNCYTNQLTELDLTENIKLSMLFCYDNRIAALDLSGNPALSMLRCYNNAIPWADLYAASEKISATNGKYLGTQTTDPMDATLNVPVSVDDVFGGNGTVFTVGSPAMTITEGTDYSIAGGDITFKSAGVYTVEITNPGVTSYSSYPAKAIATYVAGTVASQRISFTWPGATGNKNFTVRATQNKTFTVDWGDGTTDTYTGTTGYVSAAHTYGNTEIYTVTVTGGEPATGLTGLNVASRQLSALDVSGAGTLESLDCSNNRLTALEPGRNVKLTTLYCYANQITGLDLSDNPALTALRCYNNAIPWADLYAASEKLSTLNGKYLGTQTVTPADVALNVPVTVDEVFDGNETVFAVSSPAGTVTEGADYSIAGGNITFKTDGVYTVEITNPGVTSYSSYPAKVIATYVAGTVESQRISFTWTGATYSKSFIVRAAQNKTFTVEWGDGTTDSYTGMGTSNISLSHTYDSNETYMVVTVTGDDRVTWLTYLDVNDKEVSTLDISGATGLQTLYCQNNAIPMRDLYAASRQIAVADNKRLGTQTLTAAGIARNEPLTVDETFGGEGTVFSVNTEAENYSISGGTITFGLFGKFNVEMTHPAVVSAPSYPAKVVQPVQVQWAGKGSESNPYLIRSVDELVLLATNVDKGFSYEGMYFLLVNDLDLNVAPWNTGEGWNPIGGSSSGGSGFKGSFDGNDKIISGLYINRTTTGYVGLFSRLDEGGKVQNLRLEDVNITAGYNVGGIVGDVAENNTMSDCYVKGSVNATGGTVGGIAGSVWGRSILTGCRSEGTVTGQGPVGGITGRVVGSSVIDCHSASTVTVSYRPCAGGVAGEVTAGNVSGCSFTGDVSGTGNTASFDGEGIGGIVGVLDNQVEGVVNIITNCYSTGTVSNSGRSGTGGIVGELGGWGCFGYGCVGDAYVSNCYSTSVVSGNEQVGGVVGYMSAEGSGSGLSNCYSTGAVSGNKDVGGVAGYFSTQLGMSNCAALNPSITRTAGTETSFGRVAGSRYSPNNPMTGNVAFGGMLIGGGATFDGTNTHDAIGGESKTAMELQVASGFPEVFTREPWTYAPGKLPWLFGEPVEMPEHLRVEGVTTCTITFDAQGGSAVLPQTVLAGDKAAYPADPVYASYSFAGWYKEAACTTPWNFATDAVTANVTLYAKWVEESVITYTVTFDTQGGSAIAPQITEQGGKVQQPANPIRTGYTFVGWYKEADCTTPWNFATDAVTADITLYAKWIEESVIVYTVTFDTQGGSAIAPQITEQGGKVQQPANPIRTGYTFAGWYKEASCTTPWNFATDAVTADITLYAKWIEESVTTYTVIFDTQGGNVIIPQIIEQGSRVQQPTDPIRTRYTFGGWYKEADCITLYDFDDAVTGNITLYAKWTEEENVTGVPELDMLDLKVYPNPFTDAVRIAGAEECILRVINTAGVVVHTQNIESPDETVNLEHLPAGMYFFHIEKSDKAKTVRVVKQW